MGYLSFTGHEYEQFVRDPFVGEVLASDPDARLIVVDDDDPALTSPASLPCVVCCLGVQTGGPGPSRADLIVAPDDLDHLVASVSDHPNAAISLVVLLRQELSADVDVGLATESAVYAALQGSSEFAAWRFVNVPVIADEPSPTVVVERHDDTLRVTLDRAHRHNAISRRLRDELVDALRIAIVDPSVAAIEMRGNGPSFCSGGDTAEFGSRDDPAHAHLIRLLQSPARLMHRLSEKTTVFIHGATVGGGIEMAAFAHDVVAADDCHIALPEVSLGLIPGAGGTVSLPARIGRQRTAALALALEAIDVTTALDWGLVDTIAP